LELTALPFKSNCLAEVKTEREVARGEAVVNGAMEENYYELKMKHGSYKIQQTAFLPF